MGNQKNATILLGLQGLPQPVMMRLVFTKKARKNMVWKTCLEPASSVCGVPTSQNLQNCSQCLPQVLLNSEYVECPVFLLEMSWPPNVTSDLTGPEKFGAKTCEVEAHEDFRCLLVACSMLGRNPGPLSGKEQICLDRW